MERSCETCGKPIGLDRSHNAVTCSADCYRARRYEKDRVSLARSKWRREKKRRSIKQWTRKNRERVRDRASDYYKSHRDTILERSRQLRSRRRISHNCLVCGIEIPPTARALICSPLCRAIRRDSYYRYQPKNKPCKICKAIFSGRRGAKTCSPKCSSELYESCAPNRRLLKKRRRRLAADAISALIEMKVLKRPSGLSRDRRRDWNSLALTAAKSLNLIEGATR